MVIWGSFAAFCLLAVGCVLAVRWYVASATIAREASLTVISGVVQLQEPDRPDPIVARPDMTLREGDTLVTDATSQAFIRFFEYSTLTIFPNSEVTLAELRASRFEPVRNALKLAVKRGKVGIGVAPPDKARHRFVVGADGVTADLAEGSYTVERADQGTQVRVRDFGSAQVLANGATVVLRPGERTEIVDGRPPTPARPAVQELVRNGDLGQAGLAGWRIGSQTGQVEGSGVVGRVEEALVDSRQTVHFVRAGSQGTPGESFIFQEIHRDVADFSTLKLSLDLKLVYQSVAGGGYMGSEYPLLVRVNYRSLRGETFVVYGFYYQNDQSYRTDNGTLLPRLTWESYTVPQDLMNLAERPREILSLEVRASGHDYESYLSRISLQGG